MALFVSVTGLCGVTDALTDTGGVKDPQDMSLDENLATPEVDDADKEQVRTHMLARAKELAAKKLKVEMLRRGEVFVVVLPSDELFLPNDTLLRTDAMPPALRHLAQFFKNNGEYKVIIVVHSDDTGSESYRYALTDSRVQSLYECLDRNFTHTGNLFGYGVGSDIPLEPNTTVAGRKANRRIEIYVVPLDIAKLKEQKTGKKR
ncbi:MAG: OmpA family protein [Muribaculaceae bacterium]|nr:OmpA family protein [Muribaculaceae bacterium]